MCRILHMLFRYVAYVLIRSSCLHALYISRPNVVVLSRLTSYIWVIDQAFSFKVAAYWLRSFFSWIRGVEVHRLAKKCTDILTEKAWSIKDLLFGFRGNFSRRTRWLVPSGQDILPELITAHNLVHLSPGSNVAPASCRAQFIN